MTVFINSPTPHDVFAADGETHQINPAGSATSAGSTPALDTADHTGLTLLNFGSISNTSGVGLRITALSTGTFTNEDGGHISGSNGVEIYGKGLNADLEFVNLETITGLGTSSGGAGIYLGTTSENVGIQNYGLISGTHAGIRNNSDAGRNGVTNYGTIEGDQFGINYYLQPGKHMNLFNYGTIKGDTAAIATTHVGYLFLQNVGVINGRISLESTSGLDGDTIANYGNILGIVKLGRGNDLFVNSNKGTSGTVFGEAGNDHLNGGKGHNVINGGAGMDTVNGGRGSDTLIGGTGRDHFLFQDPLALSNVDKIVDFVHGIDRIDLRTVYFTKLGLEGVLDGTMFFKGAAAHDADDHIIYNPANGWLIYDSNGSAAGGAHHFATLQPNLSLTNGDFFALV